MKMRMKMKTNGEFTETPGAPSPLHTDEFRHQNHKVFRSLEYIQEEKGKTRMEIPLSRSFTHQLHEL